eukprot:GFKZ01003536.1.p1 GENE.GFKZ01003536.1~~GFKZ01003536.1.p1  ORF type:complete len:520 (+),score=84.03 GFKZ01003536.1:326-1885(+)
MLRLTLTHNGRLHPTPLELPPTTPLSTLHTALISHLSLPAGTTLRLLVSGTQLSPTAAPISTTPLATTPSLYILSTPPSTLSSLRAQKPDPLIRPFGKAPPPKYTAAPRATRPAPGSQPSDYGFARVEALPGFHDTAKAQAILEELSTDPGFLHVMRVKRWRVGALKEMPPEGRVGVDPVCVLGYNTNKGQEIHLRLRTDDRLGFRSRMSVRQVLAHELAHNEVSDHNNEFKELMRWIEREADKADWRRSAGNTLVEGWEVGGEGSDPLEEGEATGGRRLGFVGTLGGSGGGGAGKSRLLDGAVGKEGEARGGETVVRGVRKVTVGQSAGERLGAGAPAVAQGGEEVRDKKQGAVAALMELGFSEGLCRVALRENGREVGKAADWLMRREYQGEGFGWKEKGGGEEGEQQVLSEQVRESVGLLMEAGLDRKQLVDALDGLHLYLGNLLRHPEVEGYRRINAGNEGFRRRVGEVREAVRVLEVVGFKLGGNVWKYEGVGGGRVWVAKCVVQQALVEVLGG